MKDISLILENIELKLCVFNNEINRLHHKLDKLKLEFKEVLYHMDIEDFHKSACNDDHNYKERDKVIEIIGFLDELYKKLD